MTKYVRPLLEVSGCSSPLISIKKDSTIELKHNTQGDSSSPIKIQN